MGVIPTARVYDIYLGTYEYLSDGGENRHYRRMGVITRGLWTTLWSPKKNQIKHCTAAAVPPISRFACEARCWKICAAPMPVDCKEQHR